MDAFEQRLTADLDAAAEAAALTPPDRAAVAATVAARRRGRRLRAGLAAAAAAVLVVAGLVAVLAGRDADRVEIDDRPPATTAPHPTTTAPGEPDTRPPRTTTTTGTGDTPGVPPPAGDSATTASSLTTTTMAPTAAPVTRDEVAAVAFPFAGGTAGLPPACRDYWDELGFTPGGNGLSPQDNGITVSAEAILLADVDGDGADDGLAPFTCETGGVLPPGGALVVLAADRSVVTDDATLQARHEARFGDPRTRVDGPLAVEAGDGGPLVSVELVSYRPGDPDAGGSARAVARYRLADGTLSLVDLRQLG